MVIFFLLTTTIIILQKLNYFILFLVVDSSVILLVWSFNGCGDGCRQDSPIWHTLRIHTKGKQIRRTELQAIANNHPFIHTDMGLCASIPEEEKDSQGQGQSDREPAEDESQGRRDCYEVASVRCWSVRKKHVLQANEEFIHSKQMDTSGTIDEEI